MGRLILLAAVCLAVLYPLAASGASPDGGCLTCHDDHVFRTRFPGSVHGVNGCASCHGAIRDLGRHMRGEEKPASAACASCHRDIAVPFAADVHYIRQGFRCQDCHGDIHAVRSAKAPFRKAVVEKCTACHDAEDYAVRGHGKAVLAGNPDAAACSDCHGLHSTPSFPSAAGGRSAQAREYFTQRCYACHGNADMMKRNRLSAGTVLHYEETYHGKVRKIGDPSRVAGCTDCHADHNILPKSDPASPLHSENLVRVCGQCHQGFHPRFVKFNAHPDYGDRRRYPLLFWTRIFMIALLTSVFFFFWLHTALWWRKAYWEKCRSEQAGIQTAPVCDEVQVRRFSPKERVMHVLLILSFFTLVMTGLPLKYYNTQWAKLLMGVWGGVSMAGFFHRFAAVVLWGLFLYTVWLSIRFLFPNGKGWHGWIGRLLGPDSLCPNLKDLRDIQAMFRWFFDRGEMPKFDRWTYWEKFDFFAVFWGMTAIGVSGLMLWVPEVFSWIFPGWVLNVATLVHSEEALLAALFIFTVHFFNNHFVPNKFPMEPNIFTGTQGLEQFRTERPLEYERAAAEGRLEAMTCKPPGILIRFLSSALGLASLLLGMILSILMLWSILFL